MSRIGIDGHAIGQKLTGNETYIANLIDGLQELNSDHEFVVFFTQGDAADKWKLRHPELETVKIFPENPLVRIPLVTPWFAHKHHIDLLHVQYVGPPVFQVPLVTSIHDIVFERYPEFYTRKEVIQFKTTFRLTALVSKKIITISECSKRDIVEFYGVPADRVVVTYLAANDKFFRWTEKPGDREALKKYGVEGPYFLAVGNLQPRKNLVRLIGAYARLRDARPEIRHKLVIVGKKAWKFSPILENARQSLWSEDIILTDYVPDEDLPILYGHAALFAYPSIYEGFGLPPLEAMACGTPVVVSDRASLPEVVGDAGIMVNPYSENEIAAAMASVVLEPAVAEWYSVAGKQRAAGFSWAKTAEETMSVYEEVLAQARLAKGGQ